MKKGAPFAWRLWISHLHLTSWQMWAREEKANELYSQQYSI